MDVDNLLKQGHTDDTNQPSLEAELLQGSLVDIPKGSSLSAEQIKKLKDAADHLVESHCKKLDELISQLHSHPDPSNMSLQELERLNLQIPAELYRLEKPETESQLVRDLAKVLEDELFDIMLSEAKQGTTAVRQAIAGKSVASDRAFTKLRDYAYYRFRKKREAADKVFDSVRKVISLRIEILKTTKYDTAAK